MTKIAIDARIINSSTGRYVERLLSYLEKIDRTSEYLILIPTKDLGHWKPSTNNFKLVPCDIGNYSIAEQTKFKTIIKDLEVDLVHFCMPQQPIYYKGRTVTTFHDLTLLKTYNVDKNWFIYHIKQAIGKWMFRKVAHKSTEIIAPTNFTKQELINFAKIPDEKISVTYESADIKKEESKPIELPFDKYILYVGKQSSYKNIRRLGEAHQKLLETNPELVLVLVGSIDKAALMNQTFFNKNNFKNIHFTGRVDDQNLAWLYSNCACYVFPSLMEGFGLPGIEAMGLGAPVISSNATCLPEVYGDGAIYFDPLDVDDMAAKIDLVLSDDKLRSDLIERGYQQFNKYSWEKMAQETHEVYMKALNK
ncbi:glycosyl transferase family 1 [Candidatus Saccharibacteria bacterium HGW-Saccharibacteria-1]|jgi:glycosyltransferase involved in cell wall biosynthesis|nr:MAG: glycosyl transferase family 1 [Candidatus Saccharibacteria bacterium HGW-Saccharibacteria-1]